jgi:hypothetical protein
MIFIIIIEVGDTKYNGYQQDQRSDDPKLHILFCYPNFIYVEISIRLYFRDDLERMPIKLEKNGHLPLGDYED